MSKKPVKTFHPSQMAKSLEAQNLAIGLLISDAYNVATWAEKADEKTLRDLAKKLGERVEGTRKVMWPENYD